MNKTICLFDGEPVPRSMCFFDRESSTEPDDCMSCNEVCEKYFEKGCKGCPIGLAFAVLAAYEATNLEPSQIMEIDRLYAEKCHELAVLQESALSGMELVRVWHALQVNKQYERARSEGRLHIAPLPEGADIWKIVENNDTGELEVQEDSYIHGMTEYAVGKYNEDFFATELEAKIALKLGANPSKS